MSSENKRDQAIGSTLSRRSILLGSTTSPGRRR